MGARVWPIVLLIGSNVFMTFAWYGHLKFREVALWKVIVVSWGIAFFEYCLRIPANRLGSQIYSARPTEGHPGGHHPVGCVGVFSVYYFGDEAALEPREGTALRLH